jgi:cytochrome c556
MQIKHKVMVAAFAVGTAASMPAAAQFQKPADAIKYRQSAFTVMGNHVSRIGAMVQNRVPFDAATALANAEIVATLSKLPYAGFVEGTAEGTKAKPAIWSQRAKFDAAASTMQDNAAKLSVAAKTGDLAQIRTAFGALGASCKACHDDFRE